MSRRIDPPALELSVEIHRANADEYGLFRSFHAAIHVEAEDYPEPIGYVEGWICWDLFASSLFEAGDSISYDAMVLAKAVDEVVDAHFGIHLSAALMVDKMWLQPDKRRQRLSRALLDELLDLLQLEPTETVVVLTPEPQVPGRGGPYPGGPVRDAAMTKLCDAYRESGLELWGDGPVWCLPVGQ